MTHDYPPTREVRLADARDEMASRAESDDADAADRRRASNQADALSWAVEQWGDDATVTLEAYTARTRARVLDELQTSVMGDPGPEQTQIWLTAAGIAVAPWLDDEDIPSKAAATGQLPPALVDWCNRQLDDVNDLSEGN